MNARPSRRSMPSLLRSAWAMSGQPPAPVEARCAARCDVHRWAAPSAHELARGDGSVADPRSRHVGDAYSPLFSVERITVAAPPASTRVRWRMRSRANSAVPLPLVNASEIKAALVGFPLVETYTTRARPPHELVVRIVERTPIGAYRSPAGYTLVDARVSRGRRAVGADGIRCSTVTGARLQSIRGRRPDLSLASRRDPSTSERDRRDHP